MSQNRNRSSALRPRRTRVGHENVIVQAEISLADDTAQSDTSLSPEAPASLPSAKKGSKMSDQTTGETKTRRQNLTYTYRDKDGQENDKFTDDARSVIFMVDASKKRLELKIDEIIKDQTVIDWLAENAPISLRAMLFGLKTTVGNAVTSVKNGDAGEMFQAIENRKETLIEGEWREGGERGASPKLVLEACLATYLAKMGHPASEQRVKEFRDIIRKEGTKYVLTNPNILAEFEAIKLREQQKKVDEAKQAAQAAPQSPSMMDALMS